LRYVEGDGDVTEYHFENLRVNEDLPEDRFVLDLPQEIDRQLVQLEARAAGR
jgi:outer membrane lipoprotein-sorting protein